MMVLYQTEKALTRTTIFDINVATRLKLKKLNLRKQPQAHMQSFSSNLLSLVLIVALVVSVVVVVRKVEGGVP